MLDVTIPGSFWNTGPSNLRLRCGSNWVKIEEAPLKISLQTDSALNADRNCQRTMAI